jgi:hypothetical protein
VRGAGEAEKRRCREAIAMIVKASRRDREDRRVRQVMLQRVPFPYGGA